MRIKSLWISKYKNIKDLNLEFKFGTISLLVGRNGLGKSNLIEILALIFRDLDLVESESDFQSWAYSNFEYVVLYNCRESEIRIECKEGLFKIYTKKKDSDEEFNEISFSKFRKTKDKYLPNYIIGYYSGENKRIKEIIRPYEEKVWNDLKQNKGLDQRFRRLFFAENYHAKMILLTLLLYKEQNENNVFKERITELLSKYTSFSQLYHFSLELQNPIWYNPNNEKHQIQGVSQLVENFIGKVKIPFPFWNAKGKANDILTFFYNHSDDYPVIDFVYSANNKTIEQETIELNSINFEQASTGIFNSFGHPIAFFDSFETLSLINVVSKISLEITSNNDQDSFDFTGLSEGEQQLITILGLILITGEEECLYLLDEPDTHLNPLWQRQYAKLLFDFNLNRENSHIIVATHSPLIVQAAEDADIFLYKRDTEENIIVDNNDSYKIHNWRIDQVLASEYFEFPSTRPPSLDNYMILREKILLNGELHEGLENELKEFENEFGVLPTGETLEEIESMMIIKTITKNYRNNDDQNSKA